MNNLYDLMPLRPATGMRQAGRNDEAITIRIMKKVLFSGMLFFGALLLNVKAATITNPGFETGNLTGWEVHTGASGQASVIPSASPLFGGTIYLPPEGSHFADLWAGDENIYTTISQTFTLTSGQTLTGWAAFLGQDSDPYFDDAFAQITGPGSSSTMLWSKSVLDVGTYGSSPWESWTFTASSAGTYILTYGVRNVGSISGPSEALFDTQVSSPSQVPDAGATAALFAMGLLGLAWMRRTVK